MAFTYFFRDRHTLELIQSHLLPQLGGSGEIAIWDAGCAMGPEPYSLAITLREKMPASLFRNVRIHATDIDGSNLFGAVIRSGEYVIEQMRSVPPDILKKYFVAMEPAGRYRAVDELRECILFMKHDLLSLQPVRTGFRLIICKNVLLHFTEEQRIAVLKMFHAALADGGFLVVEQTQKLPPEIAGFFEAVVSNAQIFRRLPPPAAATAA